MSCGSIPSFARSSGTMGTESDEGTSSVSGDQDSLSISPDISILELRRNWAEGVICPNHPRSEHALGVRSPFMRDRPRGGRADEQRRQSQLGDWAFLKHSCRPRVKVSSKGRVRQTFWWILVVRRRLELERGRDEAVMSGIRKSSNCNGNRVDAPCS